MGTIVGFGNINNTFYYGLIHVVFPLYSALAIALTGKDNERNHRILRFYAISLLRILYANPSWKSWLDKHWNYAKKKHWNMQKYMVFAAVFL